MNKLSIRNIRKSDLEDIQKLQPEGWSGITFYYNMYIDTSFSFPICAMKNGEVVGVANGILTGSTGWLAHIIVNKNYRRQGIGYKLTEQVMNMLDSKGCKSQSLIATIEGKKLYKHLGFKEEFKYIFFKGSLSHKPRKIIESINSVDFQQILKLDKTITGENRKEVINYFYRGGYFTKKENEISGYLLPDVGEGTILANDETSGLDLLKFKHLNKDCKSVIPEQNITAIQFCKKNNFNQYNIASRMYTGSKINWYPQHVYSRIGGFYG